VKVTVEVDCTPEEARRCLGVADVGLMQQALMAQFQQRMASAVDASRFGAWNAARGGAYVRRHNCLHAGGGTAAGSPGKLWARVRACLRKDWCQCCR
jgi:hypothetical protein